jgi:hypothetical protein
MRRKARVDSNQSTIVKALRGIPGVSVKVTSSLPEFVDIVVGFKGQSYLIEIKAEGKKKQLKDSQKEFRDEWNGQWVVCENLDEILKTIGILK